MSSALGRQKKKKNREMQITATEMSFLSKEVCKGSKQRAEGLGASWQQGTCSYGATPRETMEALAKLRMKETCFIRTLQLKAVLCLGERQD